MPSKVVDVANARNDISWLAKALVKISENVNENDSFIKRLCDNREATLRELDELKSKQKVKTTVVCKEVSKPSLVCNAHTCVEHYKVSRKMN